MKLKNKKTGEIKDTEKWVFSVTDSGVLFGDTVYNSLAELCKEWEDYEEPKEFYYIDEHGNVCCKYLALVDNTATKKEIGNYFETKEEAEKAVEKLKAWKRLQDKWFEFCGYEIQDERLVIKTNFHRPLIGEELDLTLNAADSNNADLDLLFGGEE